MPIPSDWAQRLRNLVENWTSGDDQELLGTTSFDKFILTERANSWADFVAWLGELRGSWCFRGQRDENWILDTSLDRAVKKADGSGYYHLDRRTAANDLLFRFQQQAHQYIQELPSPRDVCSWFAIMQHHGVPTMFLDWTSSPYVAMYFAFEEEPAETGCALWAVDLDWLENTAHQLLPAKHTCSLPDAPEDLFSTQEKKIYEFDRFLDDAEQLE